MLLLVRAKIMFMEYGITWFKLTYLRGNTPLKRAENEVG